MTFLRTVLLAAGVLLAAQAGFGQDAVYMREVKPILAASCYTCHGAIKQKGGLRLDTVKGMTEGGDHGPALVPGKADASMILKHIRGEKGFKRMPPEADGEALKPAQIAALQRWIEQGATHPKDEKPEPRSEEHTSELQ